MKTRIPVVLGEGDVCLLGTVTLEEQGLEVDPATLRLKLAGLLLIPTFNMFSK